MRVKRCFYSLVGTRLKIGLLLFCGLSAAGLRGQPALDTLRISGELAEARFLQHNLLLLAAKLDVSEAEARIVQARLWPNPTISIGELNLWSNHGSETLGTLFGSWGNTSQVSVDVEQLISTAAKRRKQVALEQVGLERAEMSFEEVLRSLKLDFRSQLSELWYTQQRLATYAQQLTQIERLLNGYGRQVEDGNVGHGTYLRLQAFELEALQSFHEIKEANLVAQRELKVLLGLPPQQAIILSKEPSFLPAADAIKALHPATLIEIARENRPDLKAAELDIAYAEKLVAYERALRIPDVVVGVNYDRGGNIMRDFVGVGVSMELPFFHKNQGNIKIAQLAKSRSELLAQHKRREVDSDIVNIWSELILTLDRHEKLDNAFEANLEHMLAAYHRSFATRDVSLLEYLDFLEAYLSSKDAMLEIRKNLQTRYEALNYAVGRQVLEPTN